MATIADDELQATLANELAQHDVGPDQRLRQWLLPLLLALGLGLLASYAFARWSRQLFARYHADMLAKNQVIADNESLFRAVFDNAAAGIAQLAPDGRFLQINQRFCQWLGYTCLLYTSRCV